MPAPTIVPLTKGVNTSKDDPSTKHPEYSTAAELWDIMTDVCTSEQHIHKQGEKYLPILNDMTPAQYTAYKNRGSFPMFTKHTLESFIGMSMRKEILIDGVDPDHKFFENVNGKGDNIKLYSKNLVKTFLKYGRCGTLVDLPATDGKPMSVAEAERQNINPQFAFYVASSIINWKKEVINNVEKIVLVVLEEQLDVGKTFSHKSEVQYRVLMLTNNIYHQLVYNSKGEVITDVVPEMGGRPLDFIPFIFHGGVSVLPPPLLPIAEQNLHWYSIDADYRHGLHYVSLPTPWVRGVEPTDPGAPKSVGPTKLWFLPEDGSAGMLEFSGAGLGEVAKAKENVMTNITVLSSQILVPRNTTDGTATAATIRNATETASLSSIVQFLSIDLTEAVMFAAKWGGFYNDDLKIEINADFIPLTLSGADVAAYVNSCLRTGFSQRTLFDLLKKGEIIPGDRKYEEEQEAIDAEAAARLALEIDQAKKLEEIKAMNKEDSTEGNTSVEDDSKPKGKDLNQKDRKTQADANRV